MMAKTNNTKQFYKTEIPSDWEVKSIEDVYDFITTPSFSREMLSLQKTDKEILYIHYGDIHSTYKSELLDLDKENGIPFLKDEHYSDKFNYLQDGDLIIADASEDYLGVGQSIEMKNIGNKKIIGGLHTLVLRNKVNLVENGFNTYIMKATFVHNELKKIATGTSVYGISKGNLSKIKIPLPPLSEQKAIASVLSTWDVAIHKKEQLITQKELRKKWLMQQLLTGKKRLKGFEDRYKKQTVEEVLLPVRNSLSPESNVLYRQIGIRSHGKGIFLKEMVEGKIIGNKRVFWIEPDCLILNIVFAWEQAIAITTKAHIGMIASHRFPMFKPLPNKLDLEYILYFFKSPRGKQMLVNASPGGAGRNKTLGQNEFLNQILTLPSIEEQAAIAQVLQAADKEITLLRAKADKLREQKRGLMQLLLTGKKRLNQNFEN